MAKQTAVTEFHSAKLSSDFGYQYAVRLFGQEAVDSVPVYQKGVNKGKPKGYLCWHKVTKPGWDRRFGLVRFGTCRAWISSHSQPVEGDSVMQGMFLGRVQSLAASACLLGDENRKKWMDEERRNREENLRRFEELKREV